jgi:TonB family protein
MRFRTSANVCLILLLCFPASPDARSTDGDDQKPIHFCRHNSDDPKDCVERCDREGANPKTCVRPPKPYYQPEPSYSPEAKKRKYEGTVVLQLVVGADGHPHNISVLRSQPYGLDEKAKEAVSQWLFEPALQAGNPMPVLVTVEVNFRFYH